MDHVRQIPQVGRAVGGPARGDDGARLPRRMHRRARGSARWSPASRTATSRTSAGSSRRSTCCRAAAPSAVSARLVRGGAPRLRLAVPAGGASGSTCVADALELLPLLWGPGAPAYRGRVLDVPEAACYPRPLQEHVPIIVGGQGERRTLRLVAERADGCNLFGDPARVRREAGGAARALRRGRPRPGGDRGDAPLHGAGRADGRRGRDADGGAAPGQGRPVEVRRERRHAATVAEQIERYGELADAGVQTAIVRLADVGRKPDAIARFAPVLAAFGEG